MLSKWWVVFTSVLYFSILNAQYTDTVHRTDTQYEFTFAYNWDNTFLTSVSELRDSNTNIYGWGYLQFKQYDVDFNIIRETRFQDSNYRYFGRGLTFYKDAYYFCGTKFNIINSTPSENYLIKFDTLGNKLWERNYFQTEEVSGLNLLLSFENKLHIVGNNYYPSTTNKLETFLCQIDTSGNIEWTKKFNQAYGQQPISYKKTSDGGSILATTYIINNTNYRRTAIYKLDTNGNTQWSRIIGYQAPFQGPTVESWAAVTPMPDGNYICHGSKDDYQNGTKRSWLVKLSSSGTVLLDTVFDFSNGYDVFSNVSSPIFVDNGFYIIGGIYDDINATFPKRQLNFFDYDFNLKWSRKYWKRQAENAINPVKKLENGFIAMAGFVFPDSPDNTADEWFMVIDSMGCETVLCAETLSKTELPFDFDSKEIDFEVFPNPTHGILHFKLNSENVSTVEIAIHDVYGKQIEIIKTHDFEKGVDFSGFSDGIYFVSLSVDGIFHGMKRVSYVK